MEYAFGEALADDIGPARIQKGSHADDEITDYPDITMYLSEVGRARSILATQFNAVSKTMHSMPIPKYSQVDKMTQLGRQQVMAKRFTGDGMNYGHWGNELERAFMYGNGVGIGHLRIGLDENPLTKLPRADVRHYSPFQCVLDRHDVNKQKSQMVAFVDYLSKSEAYKIFGKETAEQYLTPRWQGIGEDTSNTSTKTLKAMRVVYYYDLGFGGGDPTYLCFPGSIHEDPLTREESDFWRVLPHAAYTHFQPPGMRHPIGQIGLQMSSQEMLNVAYRNLRQTMVTGRGLDIMDDNYIDDEDAEAWKSGEPITRLRATSTPERGDAFKRLPPMQVDPHLLALIGVFQQQFNTDANETSWDRGNTQPGVRSATENMILNQRSGSGAAWQKRQIAHFYIDLFDKLGTIMGDYDRDPVLVDINGMNVLLNDPEDDNTWLTHWFAEKSDISIDYADINFDEVQAKQERQMLMLQNIAQVAMQVNPMKFVAEVLKAAGYAPEEWMPPEMLQMALVPAAVPMMGGASPAGQVVQPLMESSAPGGEAKKALSGGPQPYAR